MNELLYYCLYLFKYISINIFLFFVVDIVLNNNIIFKSYTDSRKKYIIKNINKSLILFYLSTQLIELLEQLYHSRLENEVVKHYATIYVSSDIVALLLVPNLPKTTVIHHRLTTLLLFINYFIDYTKPTHIGLLLIVYTVFSTLSFLVNFFLAIRFLYKKERLIKIKWFIYYNYLICCLINWSIHIYYISINSYKDYTTIPYFTMYILFFVPIVRDDLILMNWLRY